MGKHIGIDVGGTTIKAGITDERGNILHRLTIPTDVDTGFEKIALNMVNMTKKLLDSSSTDISEIRNIGIGIPGIADKNGKVYFATNLFWKNVELGKVFKENFPNIEIKVDNDATVAAIAEQFVGSIKGVQNAVMLTLGTGVGGGIMINGLKYSGHSNIGSEIGHMVIGEKSTYRCACGRDGCFETYCSATGVIRYAQKLINDGEKSILAFGKSIDEIDAEAIFDGYVQKDEVCVKTVKRFVNYFSIGIANIVNILDPEYIVIGGGMSNSFDLYIDDLNRLVSEKVMVKDVPFAKIVKAELGNDAGIIGAAMLK